MRRSLRITVVVNQSTEHGEITKDTSPIGPNLRNSGDSGHRLVQSAATAAIESSEDRFDPAVGDRRYDLDLRSYRSSASTLPGFRNLYFPRTL